MKMKLSVFLKMFSATASDLIIWSKAKSLEAVKRNGDALQYVKEQTEPVCLEAVKRNGDALRYVKEQTEPVCLEAVKRNGDALQYVNVNIFEIDIKLNIETED